MLIFTLVFQTHAAQEEAEARMTQLQAALDDARRAAAEAEERAEEVRTALVAKEAQAVQLARDVQDGCAEVR